MGGVTNTVNGYLKGAARWYLGQEVTQSSTDLATASMDAMQNPGPILTRDTGLSSRTLKEALEVLAEAAPTLPGLNLFLDQHGFRSITQSIRDMNDAARLSILNRAETFSITNALAARGMQIRTDLIVSEGFRAEPITEEKNWRDQIQAILDEHWKMNDWEDRMFERVFDLGVTGEMIRRVPPLYTPYSNEDGGFQLGRFRCGMILPHLVHTIRIDPWNYEALDHLVLQQYAFPAGANLNLKIMRDDRPGEWDITGECFYLGVNRRPGASRGLSDLTPALEWLDLHDQSLFSDAERAAMMMRFVWDVSIEGATKNTIQQYMAELKANPIRPGTVRVHNHKEVWDAIAPDLKIADTSALREDIFKLAWGAMGLPRHWYVDAENVNKANAEEMVSPVFAWARSRRRQFIKMLELECRYAIQVARDAGRLRGIPQKYLNIQVVSRDPERSGLEQLSAGLQGLSTSLIALVQANMFDQVQACDVIRNYMGSYGIDLPETKPEEMYQVKEAKKNQEKLMQQMGGQGGGQFAPGQQPQQGGGQFGQNGQQAVDQNGNPIQEALFGSYRRFSDPLDSVMREAHDALKRDQLCLSRIRVGGGSEDRARSRSHMANFENIMAGMVAAGGGRTN